jgi:hypothetical protein
MNRFIGQSLLKLKRGDQTARLRFPGDRLERSTFLAAFTIRSGKDAPNVSDDQTMTVAGLPGELHKDGEMEPGQSTSI